MIGSSRHIPAVALDSTNCCKSPQTDTWFAPYKYIIAVMNQYVALHNNSTSIYSLTSFKNGLKVIVMKKDNELNVKIDANDASADDTRIVPSAITNSRYISENLGKLKLWMRARLNSHDQRVSSLRVYRQNRLDGRV